MALRSLANCAAALRYYQILDRAGGGIDAQRIVQGALRGLGHCRLAHVQHNVGAPHRLSRSVSSAPPCAAPR